MPVGRRPPFSVAKFRDFHRYRLEPGGAVAIAYEKAFAAAGLVFQIGNYGSRGLKGRVGLGFGYGFGRAGAAGDEGIGRDFLGADLAA